MPYIELISVQGLPLHGCLCVGDYVIFVVLTGS
jgi:hypothetical protein